MEAMSSCTEQIELGRESDTGVGIEHLIIYSYIFTAEFISTIKTIITTENNNILQYSQLTYVTFTRIIEKWPNQQASQQNQAGKALHFWNATVGVWSHVEDRTKLCCSWNTTQPSISPAARVVTLFARSDIELSAKQHVLYILYYFYNFDTKDKTGIFLNVFF